MIWAELARGALARASGASEIVRADRHVIGPDAELVPADVVPGEPDEHGDAEGTCSEACVTYMECKSSWDDCKPRTCCLTDDDLALPGRLADRPRGYKLEGYVDRVEVHVGGVDVGSHVQEAHSDDTPCSICADTTFHYRPGGGRRMGVLQAQNEAISLHHGCECAYVDEECASQSAGVSSRTGQSCNELCSAEHSKGMDFYLRTAGPETPRTSLSLFEEEAKEICECVGIPASCAWDAVTEVCKWTQHTAVVPGAQRKRATVVPLADTGPGHCEATCDRRSEAAKLLPMPAGAEHHDGLGGTTVTEPSADELGFRNLALRALCEDP